MCIWQHVQRVYKAKPLDKYEIYGNSLMKLMMILRRQTDREKKLETAGQRTANRPQSQGPRIKVSESRP